MSTRREDEKSPISEQMAVAKKVAEQQRVEARKLREFAGDQPWGSERMTKTEKLSAFSQVMEDDEFWTASTKRTGRMLHLSDGLVPREIVDEAEKLYDQLEEMRASGETPTGYHWMPDGSLMSDEEMEADEEPEADTEEVVRDVIQPPTEDTTAEVTPRAPSAEQVPARGDTESYL